MTQSGVLGVVEASVCEWVKELWNKISWTRTEPVRHDTSHCWIHWMWITTFMNFYWLMSHRKECEWISMSGRVLHAWLAQHYLQLCCYMKQLSSPDGRGGGAFYFYYCHQELFRLQIKVVMAPLCHVQGVSAAAEAGFHFCLMHWTQSELAFIRWFSVLPP